MGWIHKGTNGVVGTANRVGKRLSREESEQVHQEKVQQREEAEAEYQALVARRKASEAADNARVLQVAVSYAKESEYPKPTPTDEEISGIVTWFASKEDGLEFLQEFLAERNWDKLEDLWEMREALILAQSQYLG